MARIVFVVFSLALALTLQSAVVKSNEPPHKGGIEGFNKKQDEKEIDKKFKKDVSVGLKDAVNRGIVKDMGLDYDESFSPQQEEEYLMKLFFKVMMRMADEGIVNARVLRAKLFPGGVDNVEPKIPPEVMQALRDAIKETENVQDGTALKNTKQTL